MNKTTPVEELFTVFNETAMIIKEELSCTYLEALAETGENMFHGSIIQEELSELTAKRLKKSYESIQMDNFTKEEIRKSFQLVILKGMNEMIQPNHQMTPDAVGLLIGYLANKFVQKDEYRLLDPAVGTGNLLTTVINQQPNKTVHATGIEIDDILIRLSYVNANLQQHPLRLFNQDSLEPLFIEEADAVVSDLPVGYYPNDVRAADYEIKADKGHTYAHHLFIEQSIHHVKEGGYLFFIVPNGLFESEQAPKLHSFIKKHANIQGLLQLPLSLFKNEKAAKSIFILQKKGEGVKPPKQVLLANLPSLSKTNEIEKILLKIDGWYKENK
ncbi:class I SAM-dependent methyltransferase [Bacillus sp. FJAT-29937]|uniref:class I SAM-dependent methyltransferase n=1 Tax=Bacillus sp. FJAT-29937 TaxID=1720553 RepID=UPI000834D8B2|nr:class I SAM-dependent methyltransferase [Bacillus sp. FJAT-29937]